MSDRCAVKLFSYQPSLSAPSTGTWTSGIGMLSKFLPFCHQRRETDQSQSSDQERNRPFLHQPSPPTIVIQIKRPLMRAVVLFIKAWKSNLGVCWVHSGLINTFKTQPSYKRSTEHASTYLVPLLKHILAELKHICTLCQKSVWTCMKVIWQTGKVANNSGNFGTIDFGFRHHVDSRLLFISIWVNLHY